MKGCQAFSPISRILSYVRMPHTRKRIYEISVKISRLPLYYVPHIPKYVYQIKNSENYKLNLIKPIKALCLTNLLSFKYLYFTSRASSAWKLDNFVEPTAICEKNDAKHKKERRGVKFHTRKISTKIFVPFLVGWRCIEMFRFFYLFEALISLYLPRSFIVVRTLYPILRSLELFFST